MNKLTLMGLVRRYCRQTKSWAVVLYPSQDDGDSDFTLEELQKAVPFLEFHHLGNNDSQAVADETMIVLCESEDECNHIFGQIRGDDEPENNNYDGPCRVYAWTCGSNGEILTENT